MSRPMWLKGRPGTPEMPPEPMLHEGTTPIPPMLSPKPSWMDKLPAPPSMDEPPPIQEPLLLRGRHRTPEMPQYPR